MHIAKLGMLANAEAKSHSHRVKVNLNDLAK